MIPAAVHVQPCATIAMWGGTFGFHQVAAPVGGVPTYRIDKPAPLKVRS